MDADTAKKLRAPFAAEVVGKLPKVTCPACSKRQCNEHRKSKCQGCGNYITEKHIHIDYVGHAAITDRLLQADPEWTWEPVAFGEDGLPATDRLGGLWIRLTVAGTTRLGYGDAEGKTGPSAVKEVIGDALRNGAMRFGVGLDLWHKDGQLIPETDINADVPPAPAADPKPANGRRSSPATEAMRGDPEKMRAALEATCTENGWDWVIVRKRFLAENGMALRDCTDAVAIAKFRSGLSGVPQMELMAPATNGAAK